MIKTAGGVRFVVLLSSLLALSCTGLRADEPTVLTLTEEAIRTDVARMGVAFWNRAYDQSLKKERILNGGFEGSEHRTLWQAVVSSSNAFVCEVPVWDRRLAVCSNASYRIISGPDRGLSGTVLGWVEESPATGGVPARVRFDVAGAMPSSNSAFRAILARCDDHQGFIGQHGDGWWVFTENGAAVTTAADDVPPASEGRIAASLAAPAGGLAEIMAAAGSPGICAPNGNWSLRFWARGRGTLKVGFGDWFTRRSAPVAPQSILLNDAWTAYAFDFPVTNYALDNFNLSLSIAGGTGRVDEVSLIKGGDANPTAFRDGAVNVLKRLRPGVIRAVGVGGSSMENYLRPDATRRVFSPAMNALPPQGTNWPAHPVANGSADSYYFGMHDFLGLCREVEADPWVCVPGLIFPEEIDLLMEYLGGPTNTPGGQLRARQGRAAPWSAAFAHVNIEFGNEAWNYGADYWLRSFNGPDYWRDLIAAGKASPWYSPALRFQIAGQAVGIGLNTAIAADKTNADAFAVAPYVIHELDADWESRPREDLWSYVFGYPWYHGHTGFMAQNAQTLTAGLGLPLSVYEVNHHITGGDAGEAIRAEVCTGLGGGINIANWMMMMLQEQDIRVQNFFTLSQRYFRSYVGTNSFLVPLWGGVWSTEPGQEHYRPTFLAEELLNRVLGGDLLRVTRGGADPAWLCSGVYATPTNAPFAVPYIHAYALRDGSNRAVVLFNLQRTNALPVRLELPAAVVPGSAAKWTLAADRIDANNETNEQVVIAETFLPDMTATNLLELPPFSMTVLRWEAVPLPVYYTLAASAGTGGTIFPAGNNVVLAGATQRFDIAAATYYTIAEVRVDDAAQGPLADYTFADVRTNHTIVATFSPLLAALGTPYYWLAQYGWSGEFDAAELTDPDDDAAPTWVEHLWNTLPLDPLSRPNHNRVPYEESFERLAGWGGVYTNVQPRMGWESDLPWADGSRLIRYDYSYGPNALPLPAATHTNVLALDTRGGMLSTRFEPAHALTGMTTRVEAMLRFDLTDATPLACTPAESGIKAAYYLNAASNLVVYHGCVDAQGTWRINTNSVMGLVCDPAPWHRLSIALESVAINGVPLLTLFRLAVDGESVTNGAAYPATWREHLAQTGVMPERDAGGVCFPLAAAGFEGHLLRALSFMGSGAVDDLVVSAAAPPRPPAATLLMVAERWPKLSP